VKKAAVSLLVSGLVAMCLVMPNSVFAAPRQLKFNTFSVSGSPWHNAMLKFAELIKKQTNGDIEILVYADAQLGDMSGTLTGLRTGSIDMAYFDVGVSSFLKEYAAMQIVWCPYLFKSKADATRILNSPMFRDYIDVQAPKAGIRIFTIAGDRSPRAFQTVKGPIMKPEDLKDMKLRMIPVDISLETAKAVGAKPTGMGMSEIYMALKQGVVDGQDNGFDLSIPPKFHEAAKYWSATDHVYSVTGWYIAEKVWTSFTDAQKKIFADCAMEAGKVATDEVEKLDQDAIEILKKSGCTYVVPDREAFRKAMAGVPKLFEGKVWPEGWFEKIQGMQK
jgi:tripartite ATP-independent transporter DctP family solute receptor